MKRAIKIAIFLLLVVLAIPLIYAKTWHFWYGDLMSLKKVCKKWGEKPLDIQQFKLAHHKEAVRAGMACSLLKNQKKHIGMYRGEVRKVFGNYTGHYFSDMFPTYIIETATKKGEDTWQIVFLLNRKGNISKIIVHKNCCYE